MSKILLVEDDKSIIDILVYNLEQNNYEVDTCSNYNEYTKLNINNYNLILLDICLPDMNGLDICKKIKGKYNVPIIFITSNDNEDIIVECFDNGCDDYVVKPFRIRELLSRINRLIGHIDYIKVNNVKLDIDSNKVYVDDKCIELTSLEYKILYILMTNLNKIVTRELLLSKIYEYTSNFVNDNTLTVYIKRIREKLGIDFITTIKGIGYRIDEK